MDDDDDDHDDEPMPFSHGSFRETIDERFIPRGGGGGERRRRATCSVRGEVQGRNKQWRWKIMNRIAYINTRRLLRHIVRFICMRQPRSRRAAGHTRDKRNAQTKHATRPRRVPRTRLTFRVPPSRAAHPIVIRYTPPFASHRLASHIPRSPECVSMQLAAPRGLCVVATWTDGLTDGLTSDERESGA